MRALSVEFVAADGLHRQRPSADTPPRQAALSVSSLRCSPKWFASRRFRSTTTLFADLGVNSMVVAQFCARVRTRVDLPLVLMKDIYQHPPIGSLTTALRPDHPVPTLVGAPARADHTDCAATVPICWSGNSRSRSGSTRTASAATDGTSPRWVGTMAGAERERVTWGFSGFSGLLQCPASAVRHSRQGSDRAIDRPNAPNSSFLVLNEEDNS